MERRRVILILSVTLLVIFTLACSSITVKDGGEGGEVATLTAIAFEVYATQTAEYTPPPPTSTPEPTAADTSPQETETAVAESALAVEATETAIAASVAPTEEAVVAPVEQATAAPTESPPEATEAPPPAYETTSKGKIAYTKFDGEHSLWIANMDGSDETYLLLHASSPSWAPDGSRIAFFGKPGVMFQKDGWEFPAGVDNGVMSILPTSDLANIALIEHVGDGTVRSVSWAPGGDMLAYDAKHGDNWRIYFLGTADNRQYNIEIPGEQPSWSPDSQKLAYRSCRDNKCGIWISNKDDSDAHAITQDGGDSFPAWSPLGDKIAFHREVDGNVDIYVMNVDGSEVTRLTDAQGQDTLPAWSPDGSTIVFKSARSGQWDIYKMAADGSGQQVLIKDVGMGNDWAYDSLSVR